MSKSSLTFKDRIHRRRAIWWGQPGGWRSPGLWQRPLHHLLDRQLLRDRCWPLERWHCCDLWQRCLNHKLNSREFAAAYGVRIPQLYWSGHQIARLPIHCLPEHVVLKPSWGFGGRSAYLLSGAIDLVTGRNWNRADLHRKLIQDLGPLQRFPYMAEEMQTTEEGVYVQGVEYNFYMFGDRIGAIMRVQRNRDKIIHYSVYMSDWSPITFPWLTSLKQGPVQPPPAREHLKNLLKSIQIQD